MDIISILGAPLLIDGAAYNCAIVLHKGKILAIIPKKDEQDGVFAKGEDEVKMIDFGGQAVPLARML